MRRYVVVNADNFTRS